MQQNKLDETDAKAEDVDGEVAETETKKKKRTDDDSDAESEKSIDDDDDDEAGTTGAKAKLRHSEVGLDFLRFILSQLTSSLYFI